jgi:hypothetical protein
MALEMEPIEHAIARDDSTVRWQWAEQAFAGPYDPAAYVIDRAGTRHRGQSMRVEGSVITILFLVQPQDGDLITGPPIS